MRTITVRDLQKKVRDCVDASQEERVIITRHGRPAAVLVGIEGEDWETVALQASASFWRFIEKRRKAPTIPLEEMRERLQKPTKVRRRRAKGDAVAYASGRLTGRPPVR